MRVFEDFLRIEELLEEEIASWSHIESGMQSLESFRVKLKELISSAMLADMKKQLSSLVEHERISRDLLSALTRIDDMRFLLRRAGAALRIEDNERSKDRWAKLCSEIEEVLEGVHR